jgi:hypothetical protein
VKTAFGKDLSFPKDHRFRGSFVSKPNETVEKGLRGIGVADGW